MTSHGQGDRWTLKIGGSEKWSSQDQIRWECWLGIVNVPLGVKVKVMLGIVNVPFGVKVMVMIPGVFKPG